MEVFLEFMRNLTNPEWIMLHGGLYIVMLIIFAETGLFIGFFLPGDPLLFITGIIIAQTVPPDVVPTFYLLYWMGLIMLAGIIGNYVGYWLGRKSGALLFDRKDTWLFKKKHLAQAQAFYDKRGGGAIVIARFLPVVRTFAPIIAGVVKMDFRKFSLYNIIGGVVWVGSIVTAGYLLGENVWVQENLGTIIIAIIVAATAPVLIRMIFGKKNVPMIE